MKTLRFLIATTIYAVGVFAVVQACGGKLTIGYDDAGNYHTPDGAVWKPGAACVGWDASHYFDDGGFACDLSKDQCTQWLTPPAWEFAYACVPLEVVDDAGNPVLDDGGHPIMGDDGGVCSGGLPQIANVAECDQKDPKSDDFCSAFWSRFVTHGRVAGQCAGHGGICGMKPFSANCDFGLIRVDDDGGSACVPPCAP